MGFFSRAWNTLSKILNFFGKLADAKSRKLKQDEDRLIYLSKQQKRPLEEFPEYKGIKEEKEKINKIKELSENIPSGYDPNYYFKALITVLSTMNRTEEGLDLNQIYTFKYIGRTPEWYDLNPVVLITNVNGVHFEGINFHWRDFGAQFVESPYRKYRFDRMQSKFYRIMPDELNYVLKIPTFYPIKITSK